MKLKKSKKLVFEFMWAQKILFYPQEIIRYRQVAYIASSSDKLQQVYVRRT